MSNYSRGRGLEYEVKALFELNGWSVVRGSSSKGKFAGDMKPDLVASKRTASQSRTVLLVLAQCKLEKVHDGKVSDKKAGKPKRTQAPVIDLTTVREDSPSTA